MESPLSMPTYQLDASQLKGSYLDVHSFGRIASAAERVEGNSTRSQIDFFLHLHTLFSTQAMIGESIAKPDVPASIRCLSGCEESKKNVWLNVLAGGRGVGMMIRINKKQLGRGRRGPQPPARRSELACCRNDTSRVQGYILSSIDILQSLTYARYKSFFPT